MKISQKDWQNYIKRLRKVNEKAADKIAQYMRTHDYKTDKGMKALLDYSYAVATAYGEAASDLACQMYEEVAAVSKVSIPPAEPAATATYGETAKAVRGRMFDTEDPDAIGAAVGRLVKMAGVDTTMKNALRDGAEWAWIPSGDTCAFCLMLASNGWQKASKNAIRNGHAEHIHNNCDCTYQVRFDSGLQVEGYDPDALYDEYIEAGESRQERLNAIRRKLYAKNPDYYRAQKRAAYARRKSIEKSTKNDIIPSKGIASPIESRKHPTGDPAGIAISGYNISSRQQKVLDKLPEYDSRYIFKKRDVSMKDLAALTASEGVEFAMFTKGGQRLIIRGDARSVNILPEDARALARQGYRWSGHTHPGENYFINAPSPGDRNVLKEMNQRYSVIYSSTGRKYVFAAEEIDDIGQK